MRPRHTAAENATIPGALDTFVPGFNEAAAYSRGKHTDIQEITRSGSSFNEAAAYSRGKLRTYNIAEHPGRQLQ